MPITINGSGTITGATTLASTIASPTMTTPTMSGAVVSAMGSSVITSGTAVASTSGTSIDFTSIPSWVKRVTVMFNGVSTNGSSNIQVQIGAGSVTTTGYGSSASINGSGPVGANSTTGLILTGQNASTCIYYGASVLTLVGSNVWVQSSALGRSDGAYSNTAGGGLTLGGTLDRVRITTVNGTDTFDAGSINILYE